MVNDQMVMLVVTSSVIYLLAFVFLYNVHVAAMTPPPAQWYKTLAEKACEAYDPEPHNQHSSRVPHLGDYIVQWHWHEAVEGPKGEIFSVVAIAGTKSVVDVLLDSIITPLPISSTSRTGESVHIHGGVAVAATSIWPKVKNLIKVCQDEHRHRRVWFVGHSLGGAIAKTLGVIAELEHDFHSDLLAGVFTLGSPLVLHNDTKEGPATRGGDWEPENNHSTSVSGVQFVIRAVAEAGVELLGRAVGVDVQEDIPTSHRIPDVLKQLSMKTKCVVNAHDVVPRLLLSNNVKRAYEYYQALRLVSQPRQGHDDEGSRSYIQSFAAPIVGIVDKLFKESQEYLPFGHYMFIDQEGKVTEQKDLEAGRSLHLSLASALQGGTQLLEHHACDDYVKLFD